VTPKKSTAPSLVDHKLAVTRPRPRIVFSRDDTLGRASKTGEPTRLLIVEDDYLIGAQMAEALSDAGFEVVGIAASVDAALNLAKATSPRLAVMDIRLNDARDGIEAANELFARHRIRSVFATAHQSEEMQERAKPAKPLAWLPKPYSMMALVEIVKQAMLDLKRETD
jgi:two-component system, response regulator PdtaR